MPVRLALARFEIEQELAAVVLDRAQLVEFGVEAVGDDAALAQHRRGFRLDRGVEQRDGIVLGRKPGRQHGERGVSAAASTAFSSGRRFSVSRRPDRSRGRADFSAMRALMRSTSANCLRMACSARCGAVAAVAASALTASRRALSSARSVSG